MPAPPRRKGPPPPNATLGSFGPRRDYGETKMGGPVELLTRCSFASKIDMPYSIGFVTTLCSAEYRLTLNSSHSAKSIVGSHIRTQTTYVTASAAPAINY